ncbi:hypothetical protein BTO20_10115 [Mycobacterium dioxanotrophicus]|uniref:Uncharacterized protein n=1 Tax=Mycobacterium dioxanotrophicus TaxID=482462 RepID=A0A1Y0C126_9MYCO|nr:hypothetical protein [Mycobacterium dioxanotrophicus]ART68893.1 hypothetical protein BTO20_10115 [Mycobacterium dioxanotrophicus]
MFQLYAYVQSQHDRDLLGAIAEGVLLYPVDADVDQFVVIGGQRYRFLTMDLGAETRAIRERLLSMATHHG